MYSYIKNASRKLKILAWWKNLKYEENKINPILTIDATNVPKNVHNLTLYGIDKSECKCARAHVNIRLEYR